MTYETDDVRAATPLERPVRLVTLTSGLEIPFASDPPAHVWMSMDGLPLYVAGTSLHLQRPVTIPWHAVTFVSHHT